MNALPSRCLAPSVLSADFSRLAAEVARVETYAGLLHLDVMDGHFVPNLTIGPPVVKALRSATRLPLDCHLMIEHPERYVDDFRRAGADLISVHQEACPHLHRVVQRIRESGAAAGVALNPATPVETLTEILPALDFVLLMSVNPGFGGQAFIRGALEKVRRMRRLASDLGLDLPIQVDGGVCTETLPALKEAGVDWFVAGSAVFGAPDPAGAARALSEAIGA